jgi:hypothetical protein
MWLWSSILFARKFNQSNNGTLLIFYTMSSILHWDLFLNCIDLKFWTIVSFFYLCKRPAASHAWTLGGATLNSSSPHCHRRPWDRRFRRSSHAPPRKFILLYAGSMCSSIFRFVNCWFLFLESLLRVVLWFLWLRVRGKFVLLMCALDLSCCSLYKHQFMPYINIGRLVLYVLSVQNVNPFIMVLCALNLLCQTSCP